MHREGETLASSSTHRECASRGPLSTRASRVCIESVHRECASRENKYLFVFAVLLNEVRLEDELCERMCIESVHREGGGVTQKKQ